MTNKITPEQALDVFKLMVRCANSELNESEWYYDREFEDEYQVDTSHLEPGIVCLLQCMADSLGVPINVSKALISELISDGDQEDDMVAQVVKTIPPFELIQEKITLTLHDQPVTCECGGKVFNYIKVYGDDNWVCIRCGKVYRLIP
jgi:hypothetical protein